MRNAIGYVRVSTENQSGDDKFGVDAQREAISAYAEAHDYTITEWAIDTISGVKDNRPELDRILYDTPENIQAVIIFKNDRMARDTKLYFYYFYTLEKKNVSLLSTEEHFAEGDDFANVYRSLLMFVAEQERKNIATRTSKGRSLKAKCGGYSGGNKPYGYKVVNGQLVINPDERPIVEYVFSHYADGEPMLTIAEELSQEGYKTRKGRRFQASTIKSILNNRKFYEGMYKYGDNDWVKGVHEPILGGIS